MTDGFDSGYPVRVASVRLLRGRRGMKLDFGGGFTATLYDEEDCSADQGEQASKDAKDGGARKPSAVGGAIVVKLAEVQPEKVRWLDRGRIPLGTLTVLDGDPGVGKTSVALDYAARVSTGSEMPDGSPGDLSGMPAGVVTLSAEDDPAITLR